MTNSEKYWHAYTLSRKRCEKMSQAELTRVVWRKIIFFYIYFFSIALILVSLSFYTMEFTNFPSIVKILIGISTFSIFCILLSFLDKNSKPKEEVIVNKTEAKKLYEVVDSYFLKLMGKVPKHQIIVFKGINAFASHSENKLFHFLCGEREIGISYESLALYSTEEASAALAHELGHSVANHAKIAFYINRIYNFYWNISFLRTCFSKLYWSLIVHDHFLRKCHEVEADEKAIELAGPESCANSLLNGFFKGNPSCLFWEHWGKSSPQNHNENHLELAINYLKNEQNIAAKIPALSNPKPLTFHVHPTYIQRINMTKKKFDEQELRDFTERQLTSTALDQWISPHEQVRIKAALNKLLDKKYISKKLQQDLKKADQKLFKILRQEIKNPSDEAYTMRKVIDYLYLNRQWDLLESFIHPFLKKNREQKEALYPSYFQGLIHLERNENELAIKFLTESIELEEVKFRDFVIERAAMELGRAYAQTGNYDKVQSSYWAYALASINLERIKKRYALLSKEDFYKLLQESEETLTIDFY